MGAVESAPLTHNQILFLWYHMTCSVLVENIVAVPCAQYVLLDSLYLLFSTYMPGCTAKAPPPSFSGMIWGIWERRCLRKTCPLFPQWWLKPYHREFSTLNSALPFSSVCFHSYFQPYSRSISDFINTEAKILKLIQATTPLGILLPLGGMLWYFHKLTLKEVNKPDTIHSRS